MHTSLNIMPANKIIVLNKEKFLQVGSIIKYSENKSKWDVKFAKKDI